MLRFRHVAAMTMGLSLAMSGGLAAAQDFPLSPYSNDVYGYSALLPFAAFSPVGEETPESLTLLENGGEATIRVFAGAVPAGTALADMQQSLSADPRVGTITYERDSGSWFVISGFLDERAASGAEYIFYLKLMLSPDADTYSAIEISFPGDQRERYADLVEVVEDNMTRPRS